MSSYTVVKGDTYESVSRKVYGEESQGGRISAANPGVPEPLATGVVLVVPAEIGRPLAPPPPVLGERDAVSLLINDERFAYWENISIVRSLDAPAAVSFSAPFEAGSARFRETFRPFSYPPCEVVVGAERLFSGTIIDIAPQITPDRRTVGVSGYSLPGAIFDCTAPASAFPLEFDNARLAAIAAKLCSPFGVSVVEEGVPGAVFERVALTPQKKIGEFLADLAKQRGQVLSATPDGELLIRKSTATGSPVAVLRQGASPLVSIKAQFKPQSYFSSMTGIDPVAVGNGGSQFTARNRFAAGILRPHTFAAQDAENGSIKAATDAKLGRMFGDMASYAVSVDSWRTPKGELWEPNTTVMVEAPGAMVYKPYEFLIRSVTYSAQKDSRTAQLSLVLPGAYSGEQPEDLPWL